MGRRTLVFVTEAGPSGRKGFAEALAAAAGADAGIAVVLVGGAEEVGGHGQPGAVASRLLDLESEVIKVELSPAVQEDRRCRDLRRIVAKATWGAARPLQTREARC